MTKVINLRKFTNKKNKNLIKKQSQSISEEKYKLIILIITMISIFIGCMLFKYNRDFGINYLNNYIKSIHSFSFTNIFIFLLKAEIIYFILVFFIGTSIIGKPLVIIVPVLKCLFIGYISSYMYSEFKLKGILLCLIILYPFYAISSSTLIFACNESIYMSNYVSKVITKRNTADEISIKLYLIRFLILFVIDVLCVLISSFTSKMILQKFNLL